LEDKVDEEWLGLMEKENLRSISY